MKQLKFYDFIKMKFKQVTNNTLTEDHLSGLTKEFCKNQGVFLAEDEPAGKTVCRHRWINEFIHSF